MIHHHDKLGHSHSEAQKEGNKSSKHQFSSETALECNTEIHWHHLVSFRLLGITLPYIFLSCNLPRISRFCQPPHGDTTLAKQRQIFVRPNISTSTSPPQLLPRSLCYAARHGSKISIRASSGKLLSASPQPQWCKVKKKQPKQKEMEETQETAATHRIFSSQLGKITLFKSTDSKIE